MHLRYGRDLTEAEWRLIEPYLPAPYQCGRRRHWPMREIIKAIFYLLRAGCPWRLLPDSFPPWRTVYRRFCTLRDDRIFESLNHHIVQMDRVRTWREPMPSATVIDSQSVRTTEAGGPRGYDGGKKIMGRRRHAMVDTDGRSLELLVDDADVQVHTAQCLCSGNRAYYTPWSSRPTPTAPTTATARHATSITIEIVRKFADQTGFVVHPRRWMVERLSHGLTEIAALAKDFERTIKSATAILYAVVAIILIRRIACYA